MLRHKALIQTARYAFGFAGIVDPDEAERIDEATMRDVTPTPPEPTTATKTEPEARTVTATTDTAGKAGETVVWGEADGAKEKAEEKPAANAGAKDAATKTAPLDPPEPVLKRPQTPQAGPSTARPAAASAAPTDGGTSSTTDAPSPSGSATTAPDGDGLDIPTFLRRGVFDETAWLEEVRAKTAACTTGDALIEMQQVVCTPNRKKVSDEGWEKHVAIVRARISELALIPPAFNADVWISNDLKAALEGCESLEELNDVKNNTLVPSKPDLTPEQWKRAASMYNDRLKVLSAKQGLA
jgi:hypothetical protein